MVAHLPETAPRRWIGLHHDGDLDRGLNLPELNGEPVTPSGSRLHVVGELLLPPPKGSPRDMKIVVSAMVSLALMASLAHQGAAAPLGNKKQAHRRTMTKPPPRPQQGGSDYYENVLDKVPFGTQRWWAIKQRRSGGGG